ncbi:MAG TPA: SDR family NAD(P)-dependent oxidoreductase, partial [Saprospiraceae bacterium]|nr:SDR family NAD(P)-dependent oxidoreductase [Saprospiraceae bacterium]
MRTTTNEQRPTKPKIIAVTGAYRGIGFEIVRQLGHMGHTVIQTARNQDKAELSAKSLTDLGYNIYSFPLDVLDIDNINDFYAFILANFGKLDILINNAAVLLPEDRNLLTIDPKLYQKTISTNAEAPLILIKTLHELMTPGGRIINVSSSGGSMSDPIGGWSPAYCVAKSYLNAITRQLAYNLQEKGISVNAFDPGWVKSDMGGSSAPR